MKTYPRLTEMGVLSPLQIKRFYVNSIARTDILRIVYERPKGSILPQSRTYEFPRIQKSSKIDSMRDAEYVLETDPALREALEELHNILESKEHSQDVATAIIDEIQLLEEDIALRTECLRVLVAKLAEKS